MNNKVSFKAFLVNVRAGVPALSSSGKSARFFLTGQTDDGDFFTVRAMFVGPALKFLQMNFNDAVTGTDFKPVPLKGHGVMKANTWKGSDGKYNRDTFVLVAAAPSVLRNFAAIPNPKSERPSLVGASLTAFIKGEVQFSPQTAKGGEQVLVQEPKSDYGPGYRTYVRYDADGLELELEEGDVIEASGRLAWLTGHAWVRPVLGVKAESITVNGNGSAGTVIVNEVPIGADVELPF